jgi:uncharacterized protein (DUF342 family)
MKKPLPKNVSLNQLGVMIESLDSKIDALAEGQKIHDDKFVQLDHKIDAVHTSLKNEIRVTGLALDSKIEETKLELKNDIQRVETKLEEHIRLPAHIA